MQGLIIQNGYFNKNNVIEYSILTKKQIDSIEKFNVSINLITCINLKNPLNFYRKRQQIISKLKLCKYDFIHFQYGSLLGFLGIFVKHRNKIISICGSDLILKNKSIISYITVFLTKVSLPFYRIIVVKSQNLKNQINSKHHYKVKIIPNGVDIDFFNKKIIEKKNNKFKVVFHEGQNNRPIKNLPLALKTIQYLRENNLNISFYKFSNKSANQVKEILQSADCLLVTSLHEGSPNIVKEALSVNTPVVSVDCGDVKERLKNVNKGGVSSKYDYKELSNLILQVYYSKDKFNGREILINQGIDCATIASKLIELYKL